MPAAGGGEAVRAEEAKGEGVKKRRAEGLEMLGLCICERATSASDIDNIRGMIPLGRGLASV